MFKRLPSWFLQVFSYAMIFNWIAFAIVGFRFGAAPSGKVENGHYFLGNHGLFTEVSHSVFTLSAIWTYGSMLWLLAVVAIAKIQKHGPL